MWSFSAHVIGQRKAFFPSPSLQQHIDIQLPLRVGVLVYINIPAWVQGYLPCLCPTSLFHGRYCFPCARSRPSSIRNKSKTLLNARAQAVWSAHSLHSCTLPLSGPWVLHWGSAVQSRQTEHCAQGRVDKLWVYPHFTLFIWETGRPCWLHTALKYIKYGCCLNNVSTHHFVKQVMFNWVNK